MQRLVVPGNFLRIIGRVTFTPMGLEFRNEYPAGARVEITGFMETARTPDSVSMGRDLRCGSFTSLFGIIGIDYNLNWQLSISRDLG